jgi:hypothetical protein
MARLPKNLFNPCSRAGSLIPNKSDIVLKAIRLRAMSFLLKFPFNGVAIAPEANESTSTLPAVPCPRAIYIQIRALLQKHCSQLEKQVLQALQQSIFDPKRRAAEASPNIYTIIVLLSTYSILGTCISVR